MISAQTQQELDWDRFVGRAAELRAASTAVELALAGPGRLVLLSGEPGIGKTRLAEEIAVRAEAAGAQVLVGSCYESGAGLPYMPLVEILGAYVDRAGAEEVASRLGPHAAAAGRLIPALRSSAPVAEDSLEGADRYELFDALCTLLLDAAGSAPLLIRLEDLHWGDRPSMLFVQHLVRRLRSGRIALLATYRDTDLDRSHPLAEVLSEWRRDRSCLRVRLRGLDLAEVDDLLAGLAQHQLDDAGRRLARALHSETEGNPFFIGETLRHLFESGALYWSGTRWVGEESSIVAAGIPEGVREAIGRRLSRLSDDCQQTLVRAAVVGREFTLALLATMTGHDPDAVLTHIEEALAARLVVETTTSSGPGFAFSHALVRQTLYDELSLPRKQRLHLTAAESIEAMPPERRERHLSALSMHYRLAGMAAESSRALGWMLAAAAAARDVFAWEEAIEHLRGALDVLEDSGGAPEQRAQVLEALGDLHYVAGGDFATGVRYLESALSEYEALGMTERAAQMHSRLGRDLTTYWNIVDVPRANAHFEAARPTLESGPPRPSQGYWYVGLASLTTWTLDAHGGRIAAQRAYEIADQIGNDVLRDNAASLLGWQLAAEGRPGDGLALLEQAARSEHFAAGFLGAWLYGSLLNTLWSPARSVPVLEDASRRSSVGQAPIQQQMLMSMMTLGLVARGEIERARAIVAKEGWQNEFGGLVLRIVAGPWEGLDAALAEHRAECRRTGGRFNELFSLYWAAYALRHQGRLDEARELAEQALALVTDPGAPMYEVHVRGLTAWIVAEQGDPEAGRRHLDAATRIVGDGAGWHGMLGWLALCDSAVHLTAGDRERAAELAGQARALLDAHGSRFAGLEAARLQGRALTETDPATAAALLTDVVRAARELQLATEWVQAAQAELIAAGGRPEPDVAAGAASDAPPAATLEVDARDGDLIEAVAERALADPTDLRQHAAADGTLTLLFSDIESSMVLTERLGDEAWLRLLRQHDEVVRKELAHSGGTLVKTVGDGFLAVFTSARRALGAAVSIQRGLVTADLTADGIPLRVRIGLHTGDVVADSGDVYGRHVNLAARVAASAVGGEVLVSGLTHDLVAGSSDIAFDAPREVELKGVTGPTRVVPVRWQSGPGSAQM